MKYLLLNICMFSSYLLYAQTTISGKSFPNTLKAENSTLELNGGGTRTKMFMTMYVAGLYLGEKNNDAAKIVKSDKPMAVRLHITSGMINSENMSEAVREGFKNSTGNNTKPIQEKIDAFISVFSEPINTDDIFLLQYEPGEGVKVFKNDKYNSTVKGLDFKSALFGIWLGDSPVSSSLKKGMLGGK